MARWEDALDAQLELHHGLAFDKRERGYTTGFLESYFGLTGHGEEERHSLSMPKAQVPNVVDALAAATFNADTIYVDPDMMTIWEGLLDSFEAEPLLPQDLIAPAGFAYLPRAYVSNDVHGKHTSQRAILWHPWDIHYEVDPDDVGRRALRAIGEDPRDGKVTVPNVTQSGSVISTKGILFAIFHDSSDKDDYSQVGEWRGLHLSHIVPWAFGSEWATARDGRLRDRIFAWQALWRLMQQTLAARDRVRPDRPTRKRLAKAAWPDRDVTLIRLRRREPPRTKGEPREVNWTHRWMVRRHWRWQPYPSLGPDVRRQIVIESYIKGDPDLPLGPSKGRIFELVR